VQLAQLRDMAKQNSVQQPSEQVLFFVQKKKISQLSMSLFDSLETVQLGRQLKYVISGEVLFGV
jgi:hypothetical protein